PAFGDGRTGAGRAGRAVVGPRGRRVDVAGVRQRADRRCAGGQGLPGATAAGQAGRRARHVPGRPDRGRPGGAAGRGRRVAPRGHHRGRPRRRPLRGARALPVLLAGRGRTAVNERTGEPPARRARVLVACVGNIFLSDDGFGVEV